MVTCAEAWCLLSLQRRGAAAPVGVHNPGAGTLLALAIRVLGACADRGKGRRQGSDDRGAADRREPRLTREQRAIYDFIAELHKTKRVADKTYARVHALFGDAGMVEFVGILGYYTLVAMTLNVFRVPLPDGEAYPF